METLKLLTHYTRPLWESQVRFHHSRVLMFSWEDWSPSPLRFTNTKLAPCRLMNLSQQKVLLISVLNWMGMTLKLIKPEVLVCQVCVTFHWWLPLSGPLVLSSFEWRRKFEGLWWWGQSCSPRDILLKNLKCVLPYSFFHCSFVRVTEHLCSWTKELCRNDIDSLL